MSEELLPCPWCGGGAPYAWRTFNGRHVISCQNEACLVIAESDHTDYDKALAAWNTRQEKGK